MQSFPSHSVIILGYFDVVLVTDNVILLGYVQTDKDDDYLIEHLGNFIKFLMKLGIAHGIPHPAIAFSKQHYDYPNIVPSNDVTCVRLY